jgi:hypothetical protein
MIISLIDWMVFSLSHSTSTRLYYAKVKKRKKMKLKERGRRKGVNGMAFVKPCLKKDNTKKDRVEGLG